MIWTEKLITAYQPVLFSASYWMTGVKFSQVWVSWLVEICYILVRESLKEGVIAYIGKVVTRVLRDETPYLTNYYIFDHLQKLSVNVILYSRDIRFTQMNR